ncbi:MAG: NosR/NirI family nitrous oxide reductase transcriptional regulator [Pseudohongiellaceae bacterium]|jgi:NosR/NirI family nitrous oxide reductase transcriptional regulator
MLLVVRPVSAGLRFNRAKFSRFVLGLFVCIISGLATAQSSVPVTLKLLSDLFPDAVEFSDKSGSPPVIRAYSQNVSGEQVLAGYIFETADLPPEEVGYSAPINVLVGMRLDGSITSIQVLFYRESYKSIRGDFLATERFPYQFDNKNIAEGFRVGRDVDGVSRATLSSWAVARGIRNAGRRVAAAYMNDSEVVSGAAADAFALNFFAQKTWAELKQEGLVVDFVIAQPNDTILDLDLAFIGHDGLGELILGVDDYSIADREASNRAADGNLFLIGIDGDAKRPFRQERLAIEQGGKRYLVSRNRFVYAGSADSGLIADQVRFSGAVVLDTAIDLARPFSVLYDDSETRGSFDNYQQIEYQVPALALALASGEAIPQQYLPQPATDFADLEQDSALGSLIADAPWFEVAAMVLLLILVMTSFLKKSSKLRWATLAYTLLYLGFFDGSFVSVSHITNSIKQGPSLFLNDLPLLLILVFTLVTTVFWGRVFCSSLCPFGALQDFITRFMPKKLQLKVPQNIHDKALYLKYGVLFFLIAMALAYSELSLFQYFEPFGTLFYFSQSLLLWAILLVFLFAATLVPRFYCRYACPLGAALGVVSFVSPFKIKRVEQCKVCKVCEHACPTGAIRGPDIDFKECVRCDVCEIKLIARSGVCKHDMEEVKIRIKDWQPAI